MQLIKVKDLKPHPKNEYFFDNMEGQKWKEFLESVRTSGVIEPVIGMQDKITGDIITVSGHQRTRASLELGIEEIMCDIRVYDNEDDVIKDLIETNIRQRGDVSSSSLKMGRIIKELERIYGVRQGSSGKVSLEDTMRPLKTSKDIANELNISKTTYKENKKLLDLTPELQELVETKKLTTSIASRIIARLPQEQQEELLNELGKDELSKMTQKQMQQYIDENNKLKYELEKEKNNIKTKEVVVEIDNTDYSAVNKLKRIEDEKTDLEERLKLMTDLADSYRQDSEDYQKMKEDITYLTKQKDDLGRQLNAITDISGLVVEIDHFVKEKLAPIKYSKSLLEAKDDEIVIRNLSDIVEVVQQWCDEIKEYIPNKNNYVEGMVIE
jgi:ParB-like chromosome segregation protein Spo0J